MFTFKLKYKKKKERINNPGFPLFDIANA